MLNIIFSAILCNKYKIGVIPIWLQKCTLQDPTLSCVFTVMLNALHFTYKKIIKHDYTAWHSTPHIYNKQDRFLLTVILLRGLTRLQLKSFKYKSLFYSCTESVIKLKDLIIIRSIIANAYKIFAQSEYRLTENPNTKQPQKLYIFLRIHSARTQSNHYSDIHKNVLGKCLGYLRNIQKWGNAYHE